MQARYYDPVIALFHPVHLLNIDLLSTTLTLLLRIEDVFSLFQQANFILRGDKKRIKIIDDFRVSHS